MNLGLVYLLSFLAILTISLIVALMLACILRIWSFAWSTIFSAALLLWFVLGLFALESFHQPVFAFWHRMQNKSLPREQCLTYDPSFYRLYASYRMSPETFEFWISTHDWNLHPADNVMHLDDGEKLKLDSPEKSFATESAPNGKQLRIYYRSGVMYAAYNSN